MSENFDLIICNFEEEVLEPFLFREFPDFDRHTIFSILDGIEIDYLNCKMKFCGYPFYDKWSKHLEFLEKELFSWQEEKRKILNERIERSFEILNKENYISPDRYFLFLTAPWVNYIIHRSSYLGYEIRFEFGQGNCQLVAEKDLWSQNLKATQHNRVDLNLK